MSNKGVRWLAQSIISLVSIASLVGVTAGCDLAQPTPTMAPTPTPFVIVYTATPAPTLLPVEPTQTATPTPTRSPQTATPILSPTPTPTTSPPVAGSPAASPSPTASPYQLRAWVSQATPLKGSNVTVYAELTFQGKGVARAQMYVICRYRAITVRYPQSGFAVTDQDGVGRVSFDTTYATPGETVIVSVYVRDSVREHQAQTSFRPH